MRLIMRAIERLKARMAEKIVVNKARAKINKLASFALF